MTTATNTQDITTTAPLSRLEQSRLDVAVNETRAYGAKRAYAADLNEMLFEGWYNVEAKDVSQEGKIVRAEKDALFTVLKANGHSNPSTVWAMVRKYASEMANPAATGEAGEAGEGEGEAGEGEGEAKHTRSPMLRNVEDLTALWKFNQRQTELPDAVREAQVYIAEALLALGVDLGKIATGK
jgi:hypothetical protein